MVLAVEGYNRPIYIPFKLAVLQFSIWSLMLMINRPARHFPWQAPRSDFPEV